MIALFAITILFVEPPGESFTVAQQCEELRDIQAALEWWQSLSPVPTRLHIAQTQFITTTEDVYETLPIGEGDLTIVVIDNRQSGRLIQDRIEGGASYDLGTVWVVTTDNNAARVTHELGHALYNLPDLYSTPALCIGIDIMCGTQRDAYQQRFIGCQSLAYLGRPCQRTYLPFTEYSYGI